MERPLASEADPVAAPGVPRVEFLAHLVDGRVVGYRLAAFGAFHVGVPASRTAAALKKGAVPDRSLPLHICAQRFLGGGSWPARSDALTSEKETAVKPPAFYGEAALDYDEYLKVDELLALQQPLSDPAHHDEMLFIVIHQAYELWFKLVLHEVDRAIDLLSKDEVHEAQHFVDRVVAVLGLMTRQIHILETMRPVDFLGFRDHLKPASGFQSVQFREIEYALGLTDPSYLKWFDARPAKKERLERRLETPDLRDAFYAALRARGADVPKDVTPDHLQENPDDRAKVVAALRGLYEGPGVGSELADLAESLADLDEAFALWRQHHVQVVERIIGRKRGTGGSSGVDYLRTTTSKRCFPMLWEVRTHLGDNS